jgi:dTDP-6-deoxy-L-talose 4-dehydrogenase (NAD+)
MDEGVDLLCGRYLIDLAWGNLDDYFATEHLDVHLPLHQDLLSRAVEREVAGLFCAGTSQEYGTSEGEAFESQSVAPVTRYAIAKCRLSSHLTMLVQDSAIPSVWARIFVPYGEGQASRSLFAQIVLAARTSSVLQTSPGEQIRDFIRVEDVASIVADLVTAHVGLGTINICSGRPTSVNDFIDRVIEDKQLSMPTRKIVLAAPDYEPNTIWGSRLKLEQTINKLGKSLFSSLET